MNYEKQNLTPEERRRDAAKAYCRFMQEGHSDSECRNELLRIWQQTGFALNAQDIADGMKRLYAEEMNHE